MNYPIEGEAAEERLKKEKEEEELRQLEKELCQEEEDEEEDLSETSSTKSKGIKILERFGCARFLQVFEILRAFLAHVSPEKREKGSMKFRTFL